MTGKAGIVHCHMGDGKRGLSLLRQALEQSEIPARVFNPTHVNRNKGLFEEALKLTDAGCRIDLTAFPSGHVEPGLSAAEAFLQYHAQNLPADRLTISSDGGGCLPAFDEDGNLTRMGVGCSSTLPETLKELVVHGVPIETVLPVLTSNVADLLRLHSKGRLAQGFDADLVVLDASCDVRDVMARGRWHVKEGQAKILGTYENKPAA